MITINIQSDVFQQVKPEALGELQKTLETATRYAPYKFKNTPYINFTQIAVTNGKQMRNAEMWAADLIRFSNLEVYSLLKKALEIVQNTEEYVEYSIEKMFGSNDKKHYSTPPGTVRFYSQDLICFYNGKTWRKIKPQVLDV